MSGDLSKTDICNEAQHPQASTDAAEEKRTNRLYELAMKMSEKETSSGEDQESEPKTESENQKESLSSEDNSQSVQEELKKVSSVKPPADGLVSAAGVWRKGLHLCRDVLGPQRALSKMPIPMHLGEPKKTLLD